MANLSISELETLYDHLADHLDQALDGKRELLLVKLALLAAEALGDLDTFTGLTAIAARDL